MLRRKKVEDKKDNIFDKVSLEKNITILASDLNVSFKELTNSIREFILNIVKEWKEEEVEFIDNNSYNMKVVSTGNILNMSDLHVDILRKIKISFRNFIQETRKTNIKNIIEEHVGKLVNGKIIKVLEKYTFVSTLKNACFNVPHYHFLPTDILEENYTYLFYVAQNETNKRAFLTRVSYEFFYALINLYIPEIKDGLLKIIKIYRIFGGKIYVFFSSNINNAISHCLGSNSEKLQHMTKEIGGEKLNFIDVNKHFYKVLTSLLKIEKFYYQVILCRKDNVCYIYVDYIPVYRIIQSNMKHATLLESIFGLTIELKLINNDYDYKNMLDNCFLLSESEKETLMAVLTNIRSFYKVTPSTLCVKFLISNTTIEQLLSVLVRTIEVDDLSSKIVNKLMRNDSSIIDYKK